MSSGHQDPTYSVGELLAAADWACAHNDVETLGHIARQLAAQFAGHLHDELLGIARQVARDDARAARSWTDMRVRLHDLLCDRSTLHRT